MLKISRLPSGVPEIFHSLQGEGPLFGVPQVFVRFHDCNLSCNFCDTSPASHETYTTDDLMERVLSETKPYHSISFTGGEPLLQANFIKEFLHVYKNFFKKPVYLETNGTLAKALRKVIKYVDMIAMDFKLPSSAGEKNFWREHREFLKAAVKKEIFVKAVVTPGTSLNDITRMRDIIKEVTRYIPVVLQPVTALEKVSAEKLEHFKDILKKSVHRVEIIPQVQKLLGIK